ncbi:serine protease [Pendulispora brunnea]|uniref:Serine protease n=1 Tax=Pendulispora brunnea TaxID=2905690 RepID=A0ABZ2KNW2_9BACT
MKHLAFAAVCCIFACGGGSSGEPGPQDASPDAANDAGTPAWDTGDGATSGGSQLLDGLDPTNANYKAIGRFHGSLTCTAVFVQTSANNPAAPAYALTSGHCPSILGANDVTLDAEPGSDFEVVFNYFANTEQARVRVPVTRIEHATMKGHDLAILKLARTVGELGTLGIAPLAIAPSLPAAGAPIDVVGAPLDTSQSDDFLRRERCIGRASSVNLVEFHWHFFDAQPNDCIDIRSGSSGSPVFARDRVQIHALMNTTARGSEGTTDCYANRPCELTATGYAVRPDASYATPIVGLGGCFDERGSFNLRRAQCPLDDGRQLEVQGGPLGANQPYVMDNGVRRRLRWDRSVKHTEFTHYRYKTGPAHATNCRDLAGYGAPIALNANSVIRDDVPEAEGFYYLCLLGGRSPTPDSTWQNPRFARIEQVQIDTTPPQRLPGTLVHDFDGGGLRVELLFYPPELSQYRYKVGPPASTDCAQPDGYDDYLRIAIPILREEFPAKLCIVGYDEAGNVAPPFARTFE